MPKPLPALRLEGVLNIYFKKYLEKQNNVLYLCSANGINKLKMIRKHTYQLSGFTLRVSAIEGVYRAFRKQRNCMV